MIARNPDDHSDQWLVAKKFFKKNYISEAGGSGYSAAFTHPDPIDQNDVQRQKTQSRAKGFPYDSPTSYGGPIGTDLGGAAYQRTPDQSPPVPRRKKASDEIPYGQYGTAWEQAGSMLGTYSPGEQADDALAFGYGSHGRMGEAEVEIDLPSLSGFFDDFDDVQPTPPMTLMGILSQDDPIDAEDDTYDGDDAWTDCVYAPGAEDDPE